MAATGFACDSYLVTQIETMLPLIRYFNITDKFLPLGILPSAGGTQKIFNGIFDVLFLDSLTNLPLADTLRSIAENGSATFYKVIIGNVRG